MIDTRQKYHSVHLYPISGGPIGGPALIKLMWSYKIAPVRLSRSTFEPQLDVFYMYAVVTEIRSGMSPGGYTSTELIGRFLVDGEMISAAVYLTAAQTRNVAQALSKLVESEWVTIDGEILNLQRGHPEISMVITGTGVDKSRRYSAEVAIDGLQTAGFKRPAVEIDG